MFKCIYFFIFININKKIELKSKNKWKHFKYNNDGAFSADKKIGIKKHLTSFLKNLILLLNLLLILV